MKTPLSLGRLSVVFLSSLLAGSFFISAAQPQQPAAEKRKDAPHEEARLYRLKHVQAGNMFQLLQELLPGRPLRIAAASSGTLAAVGSADALANLQKLIETLDVEDGNEPRQDGLGFQIFSVPSIDPDLERALDMICKNAGNTRFTVDRQRNLVIVSGYPPAVESVKRLITEIDKASKKPDSRTLTLQVRLIWLATGVARDAKIHPEKELMKPPPDLKPVIDELARIGISEPVLVSQSIANTINDQEFKVAGQLSPPFFGYRLESTGQAQLTGETSAGLHLRLEVMTEGDEKGKDPLCELTTTIVSPLGHFTVLGMAPTRFCTSIFVVQIQAKK